MRSGVSFSTIDFTRCLRLFFGGAEASVAGGIAACASDAASAIPEPETCDRPRDGNTAINAEIAIAPTKAPRMPARIFVIANLSYQKSIQPSLVHKQIFLQKSTEFIGSN